MRRFLLAASLVLVAAPAVAVDIKEAPTMSFAVCGQAVLCSSYSGIESSDPRITSLIAQANTCVSRNFGLKNASGSHFRDEMGLDSDRCLTSAPLSKAPTGSTPTPLCCLVPTEGDNCTLRCDLKGMR